MNKFNKQLERQPRIKIIKKGMRKIPISEHSNFEVKKNEEFPSVVFTNHIRTNSLPSLNQNNENKEISWNQSMEKKRIASPILIESGRKKRNSINKRTTNSEYDSPKRFKLEMFQPVKRRKKSMMKEGVRRLHIG